MNTSKKHHYLPEYYLKGFTNDQNKLAIYDYSTKRIKKDFYHPSTHFYELHRNSVEVNGTKKDFIEHIYSDIDNRISGLFKKIQSFAGIPKLNAADILGLQYFVSDIFWRNPSNDELYEKSFHKTNQFLNKFFFLTNNNTGKKESPEILKEFVGDENYSKSIRPMAGSLAWTLSYDKELRNWSIAYNDRGLFVCPDNPFILNNKNSNDIFETEFIFPLTKNHLLIRTINFRGNRHLTPVFFAFSQMALFFQGTKYCAAADKEVLNLIISSSKKYELEFAKDIIFRSLI